MRQRGLFEATIQERFEAWLAVNGHVYERFVEAARALKRQGRQRYGAKAIVEHMRWHMGVVTDGDSYRLNNCWTSRLARLVLERNPGEFDGFLEVRRLKS